MSMNKDTLRVALVQCSLLDLAPEGNLKRIAQYVRALSNVDLAVFPEACLTGFSEEAMNQGEVWGASLLLDQLVQLSTESGIALAGSVFVTSEGRKANRFFLIDGANIQWQDKRHLFRMGGEAGTLTACRERKIFTLRGWRILPIICYDLRFPVWCRCLSNDYDLLLCVAAWPRGRRAVWSTLLQARAMENLSYVIGVNRVGEDLSGLRYSGDSALISPRGEVLTSCLPDSEETSIHEISLSPLQELRNKFPVWMDADSFTLHDLAED